MNIQIITIRMTKLLHHTECHKDSSDSEQDEIFNESISQPLLSSKTTVSVITVENDGNEISYEPSAHEIPKNITINDPTANPYSDGNITSYELSQEPTKLESEINTPTGKEEKNKEKTDGDGHVFTHFDPRFAPLCP